MKIKTISKLFIFSAFILTIGIKTSYAQNIPAMLYINANDVFVRETPTTSGKILGRAYFGYSAKFIKKTDKKIKIGKWDNYWYQIEIERNYKHMTGITGWVYGEFISYKEPKYKTKYKVVNDKKLNEALFKAVTDKSIALVQELLKKGSDPNYIHVTYVRDHNVSTPILTNSISTGNLQLIRILLEHGADPNSNKLHQGMAFFRQTALISAIEFKNISIIKLLLDYGANPYLPSEISSGESIFPLQVAIVTKNIEIVRLLINKNVLLNINLTMNRITPLKYALDEGLPEIAALLKRHGAKLVVE